MDAVVLLLLSSGLLFFFFNDTATAEIYTLSLHDALPIWGIKFYQQQKAAGFTPPLIICSGGQGGDEHLAEAQAMGRYLLQKGIDPHHILLEKHSHNTYENMLFSQKIIAQKGIAFTQGLFVDRKSVA